MSRHESFAGMAQRIFGTQPTSVSIHGLDALPAAPPVVVQQVETEIVAHRGWLVTADDWTRPVLMSVTRGTMWEGPSLVADQPPEAHTQHGLYALKSCEAVAAQGYAGSVLGQVALSGRVVEAQHGYRAERATIRSLMVWDGVGQWPLVILQDLLGERYQCEVRIIAPPAPQYSTTSLGLANLMGTQNVHSLSQQILAQWNGPSAFQQGLGALAQQQAAFTQAFYSQPDGTYTLTP